MHVEELGKHNTKTVKAEVHIAKARSRSRSPQKQNSLLKNDTLTPNGGILKKDLSPNQSRKSTPTHSTKSSPNRSRRSSPIRSRKSSPNHSRSNSKGSDTSPAVSRRSSPKTCRKSRDNSPKSTDNEPIIIKKKPIRDTSPNVQGENGVKSPKRKSSLKKTSRSLSIDAPTCVECYLSGKSDKPG